MKKVFVVFCLVVKNLVVSGNQLSQILPTHQTCPHVCNQNAYQNPNIYQTPNNFQIPNNYQNQNNLNIPVLLQQQIPTQQIPIIQQNTVPAILQQPTTNNQLNTQQLMLQNQLAAPILNNQFTNPVANQLSQIYMNKILSNPTIQSFLDQNGNLLYQPGMEYTHQLNNIPNPVQYPGNTPTVVNNYFLLPPELLNTEKEREKPPRRPNEQKRGREGPNRENDAHNKRSKEHFDSRRRPNHDADHGHHDIKRKQPRNPDCPIHSKKESHRRLEPLVEEAEHKHSTEERERNSKRRKPHGRYNERERDVNIPPEHPIQYQRPHPERHNGEMIRRHHEVPRPHQHEQKRPNIIIKIKERPKQSSSENHSPKSNSLEKSAEVTYQPHAHINNRRSRDDEIINDFKRKFPAIPEEVVRKLLSYLRRQMQKQRLGLPPFYYPDVHFPLRYDQLFPNSLVYDLYDKKDRRRRLNRRPNKKQQKIKSISNEYIESTTNVDSPISTIPTTTDRSFVFDDSNENAISSNVELPEHEQVSTTPKHAFETTTENSIPELGTEDTVPDINNGIIDDYFPDFTQDKSYFDSGEALNVRNLRDNRYYYTTDRNYGLKHKLNKNGMHLDKEIEEVISKPFDTKTETTSSKYEVETEIQFRTPPSLESPDLRTKQIVRQKPNDKNIFYKSSTYSDAKNPSKTDSKNHKMNNNKKIKPDNIQTMYAHSKVVKYGKVSDENDENVTPVVTYYLPDNMQYEEDGKTVIVAKRIPADHFW